MGTRHVGHLGHIGGPIMYPLWAINGTHYGTLLGAPYGPPNGTTNGTTNGSGYVHVLRGWYSLYPS